MAANASSFAFSHFGLISFAKYTAIPKDILISSANAAFESSEGDSTANIKSRATLRLRHQLQQQTLHLSLQII